MFTCTYASLLYEVWIFAQVFHNIEKVIYNVTPDLDFYSLKKKKFFLPPSSICYPYILNRRVYILTIHTANLPFKIYRHWYLQFSVDILWE